VSQLRRCLKPTHQVTPCLPSPDALI
jgi:hypothetical protein